MAGILHKFDQLEQILTQTKRESLTVQGDFVAFNSQLAKFKHEQHQMLMQSRAALKRFDEFKETEFLVMETDLNFIKKQYKY